MNKRTILIIEDNLEIREGTAEILELTGRYDVLTAENGKIGVDLALKNIPDLILCDIMMPELDGYGVLYMLSKQDATMHIPFIFLTAKSERVDMRKAMEMGADDYLVKPFDDIELLNSIESRLRKRDSLQSVFEKPASGLNLTEEDQTVLLNDLVKEARVKVYKKKQLIYEDGDAPIYVYYLVKGKVRTYLYYQDGRELSTNIHTDEQFFGYESILLNERYTESASALEDTEVALIPKDKFFELMFNKPVIATKFIKLLSGNVKEKEEQMLGFAYDSVRKRVANTLVHVASKAITTSNQDEVVIRISRDDLAALAGTANETISRMLADFKDEKLIIKEGNAIRIYSIEKLKNIKQ
ncbi:response regulator [Sphingobacterium litopenaei]|uniref:Response regulator n=1 Tax=Sphingobacterium litopenaei TaxID=2763500 RepID=A0ABR7YHH2_9SPHI|nr:response regulator [Sphingobacterium litopenaei]MBD1430758.1 response regulator [Sphingobacterium litopenaei]